MIRCYEVWLRLILVVGVAGSVMLKVAPTPVAQQWPEWTIVNVAHRGGIVPDFPENTLAAFRRAISLGVDAIEIDLRGTQDGEVVILHDETLDRTTDGTGEVTEYTLKELRQLDTGSGEPIPTYEEVLELVSGTGVKLLLDIKVSPVLDKRKVVRLTEQQGAVLDVIVGVRNLEDLQEFRRLNPNIRTLGFVGSLKEIDRFVAAGVDIVRLLPWWIKADEELVGKVQRLGKPVWATTFNAPREELEELIRMGVNGILSDYPQMMAKLIADIEETRCSR